MRRRALYFHRGGVVPVWGKQVSSVVHHFEVYKTQVDGQVIRMSCDCPIGMNHSYAEARTIDVYRGLRGPLREEPAVSDVY